VFRKILTLGIMLTFTSFAYAQQESVTITTYYPSPYGVYNELRLYPNASPPSTCDINNEGAMYYDSSIHNLKVCRYNGTAYAWEILGGGFSSCTTVSNTCSADVCSVDCPGEYTVVSGGWEGWKFDNIDCNKPIPGGNGWEVCNTGGGATGTTVFAICCR